MIWSHPTGSLYSRHAMVDEGRVYLNADSLYCFDALSGSVLWARSDSLSAHDKTTGAPLWEVEVPVDRGVLVAGDSLLYFRSSPTEIKAVRLLEGSEKWSRSFPGEETECLDRGWLAFASNTLYFSIWADAEGRGKVYGLRGGDGAWWGSTPWALKGRSPLW